MRAVVVEELGGPDMLALRQVPEPVPAPGQVAIEVAHAGVNFADVMARAKGYRVGSLPFVPGLEASGWIRALGEGVTDVELGQPVTALTGAGGYADMVLAPAAVTFGVPDGLDLRTAAALPIILPTAHALIHEMGRLRPGESVLVHGAAGGVGTVVGQIAQLAGAGTVYGVVSTADKANYALQFGYDEVFLATDFDDGVRAATGGRGVDVALDPVGGETWRRSLELLAPFGRLVSFGNASNAEPWSAQYGSLAPAATSVHGFSVSTLATTVPDVLRPIADAAFRLVAGGKVTVPITHEYSLEEAAEAHRLLEGRTSTGKIVLRVANES
jgi:NADPH:quinone reductase